MANATWSSRFTLRTKLLVTLLSAVLLVAAIGGTWMLRTARAMLAAQIDGDLVRSSELLTSLVQRASEEGIRSYLRGIAEKNVEIVRHLDDEVRLGKLTLEQAKEHAQSTLLSQRIGDTGYIYILDSQGFIRVHPKANLVGTDLSKHAFIQRQKRDRTGYLEYAWANPGEKTTRPKALYMEYFEPWDWIVSVSSYRSEFAKLLNISELAKDILELRFGDTGYAFVLDEKGKLIVHPKLAGENIFDSTDERGRHFIRDMCAMRNGTIRYFWKNPGEPSAREKQVVFRHIPELGWIAATSVYVDELYSPLAKLERVLWGVNLAMAFLLCVVTLAIATAITKPLKQLMARITTVWDQLALSTHVSQLAGSDRVVITDELQLLKRRFNDMAVGIQNRDRALADHRQNLENLVTKRTAQLSVRNAELRVVLDTIDQGLLTVDRQGHLGSERSAAFERWFGSPNSAEIRFFDLLTLPGSKAHQQFEVDWQQLTDGILPMDLALEQLPKHLERSGHHFALTYQPIIDDDGQLAEVLLVVSDITAEVERLSRETEQREVLAVFERIMHDKTGFVEFFDEAAKLTDTLADSPPDDDAVLSRHVHTLKGNAGIFGVRSIAEICHELESRAASAGILAMREALPLLVNRWSEFAQRIEPLIGTRSDDTIAVKFDELATLESQVQKGVSRGELLLAIERLKGESVELRFERIAKQAQGLADRLGKGRLDIQIEAGGLRLPTDHWAEFWSAFIHVVRNAVDHGIEAPAERLEHDKKPIPQLKLEARDLGSDVSIALSDDGRGIDWEKLKVKCLARNLDCHNRDQLIEALFSDGMSTKDEATDISGRGVGMGAVRSACLALGGRVTVESIAHIGTTITFLVPRTRQSYPHAAAVPPAVRPSTHASQSTAPR